MPTYDYRCRDCGHEIEIIHSILEDGPDACDRCRGPLIRVLHPTSVIFRGSGFYKTDSRAGSGDEKSSGASAGPGGESKDGSTSKEGSTTKPEKKESAGSTESSGAD